MQGSLCACQTEPRPLNTGIVLLLMIYLRTCGVGFNSQLDSQNDNYRKKKQTHRFLRSSPSGPGVGWCLNVHVLWQKVPLDRAQWVRRGGELVFRHLELSVAISAWRGGC